MTAPIFRSLDQLTGDVSARPSAFFAASNAADERIREFVRITAERDKALEDLKEVRAELDDAMDQLRRVTDSNAGLAKFANTYHIERDEQRENADEWRDKAEDYLATIDELQAELREQQAAARGLQNALAGAESARDTFRAMADL